ncbi:MAG: two-component system, NtrC family, sensor histidine kinase PilS [Blastocatellia bacterium]|nr:two-component system, NtrC family, sensor histidine kinase PilS [Blastocatellia bacterium]
MSERERSKKRYDMLGQRLWWLITGRLAIAVVLWLLAGAQWSRSQLGSAGRGSLMIFVVVVALSLFYATMLRFFGRLRLQAGGQILMDMLLVTWLVWVTGDLHSPYAALYIIIISFASIFLGPRGALITAVGCAAAFTSITIAITVGFVTPYSRNPSEATIVDAVQAIGLNDIAFLVVGLLAARLAERQSRSDVQLIETTQTLANLRALHERIVESIRSGVVTTDLRGRIYTFNAAAEEITGYQATNIRGQEASILFGELSKRIEASMSAAKAGGGASPRFESDCLTPEGHIRRLGFSIFPLSTESGEHTGLVITFQDLTEVRALEETSRRQDRLAAVGRVAASIAHEIRNPLAAMRGSIQVLRAEMTDDSSQAELMEIILRESDRLNRIITDYLTYARQRSHALVGVDIRDLLHETFTLLRHSPEIRDGHTLEEDLPAEPLLAQADAAQLRQVFWNLARNALQAMDGGGSLRAELRRVSSARLRITFTDTGRGMTPEQVERLFEPFSSTTGGTGLGLSIVYQIIRDHGGTINVRSREGKGTTIAIELPSESRMQESAGESLKEEAEG